LPMKLNQPSLLIALSLAATSAFAGTVTSSKGVVMPPVAPAAPGLDGFVEVGYNSEYLYRGAPRGDYGIDRRGLNPEPHSTSVITAAAGVTFPLAERITLDLGAWSGNSFSGGYSEYRLMADVNYHISDTLEAGLGYTWYNFGNNSGIDNSEVSAHLTGHFGKVDATLLVARNFGSVNQPSGQGTYVGLDVSSTVVINDMVSLVPSFSTGFGDNYFLGASGFYFVGARLDAPIRLTDHASLIPFVAVNVAIDALEDASGNRLVNPAVRGNNDDVTIYGGAALRVKF